MLFITGKVRIVAEDEVPGMKEAIDARRAQRHLSPGQFAVAAGLTEQGLAPVRRGARRNYQDKVRRGVAVALAWPLDWYDRILAGENPAKFPDVEHPNQPLSDRDRITALEVRLNELAEMVERIVRRDS